MKRDIIILFFFLITLPLFAHPHRDISHNQPEIFYKPARADSAHGFDVINYDLTLAINSQEHYIEGAVVATVIAETVLSEIVYELESLQVDDVLVDGTPATFSYESGLICIPLTGINPGQQFTTRVTYSGYPVLSNDVYHLGMIFNPSYVFTVCDPSGCRWWWPAYDHPWDKAEVDFHITIRDDWVVACNGLLTEVVDNGDGTKTHHWEGSNPMATYLACVTAANFIEIEQDYYGLQIQNFVTPGQYNNALIDLQNLPAMIGIYSEKYGEYPFEKYGNTVVPMVTFGAMEHQTMTTLGNYIINGSMTYETTIAHELAHSWFGNCLTPLTWKDVWLSEGFAVYSEAVFIEEMYGYEQMLQYVQTNLQNYYLGWAGGGSYTIYDPDYNNYFTPVTYEKAASVLHMLRMQAGDDTFFQILQSFFQSYHNQNVITEEFQAVCEDITGKDYTQFFQQWIYSPGIPSFEYTYFIENDEDPRIATYVKTHSNTATDFYCSVPFRVTGMAGIETILVDSGPVNASETIIELTVDDISEIEFDPENWLLQRGKLYYCADINNAYGADGVVLIYWSDFWEGIEIDGYNVYRSEYPEGPFAILNENPVIENSYYDYNVDNGTTYYYRIAAVINTSFESSRSEIHEATPFDFAPDQGVLIIDETRDGNGAPGNPDDIMVDDFYNLVLGIDFTSYDYNQSGAPSLDYLIQFSSIIWHDDDLPQHLINNNLQTLGCYLLSGGNLLISGWKTANEVESYFLQDFLGGSERFLVNEYSFTSALSDIYCSLNIDPDKISPAFAGTLPFITLFPEAENSIFNYHAEGGSQYEGMQCGLQSGRIGNFVFLGFPLYFMQEEGVSDFMTQLVIEEWSETGSVDYDIINAPANIQIYPNPFNPCTNLSYRIRKESEVELVIFNLKGQFLETLFSGIQTAGQYNIIWNAANSRNGTGLYIYRFTVDNKVVYGKMLLLK